MSNAIVRKFKDATTAAETQITKKGANQPETATVTQVAMKFLCGEHKATPDQPKTRTYSVPSVIKLSVHRTNAVASDDNAVASDDNAVASDDNAVASDDRVLNKMVLTHSEENAVERLLIKRFDAAKELGRLTGVPPEDIFTNRTSKKQVENLLQQHNVRPEEKGIPLPVTPEQRALLNTCFGATLDEKCPIPLDQLNLTKSFIQMKSCKTPVFQKRANATKQAQIIFLVLAVVALSLLVTKVVKNSDLRFGSGTLLAAAAVAMAYKKTRDMHTTSSLLAGPSEKQLKKKADTTAINILARTDQPINSTDTDLLHNLIKQDLLANTLTNRKTYGVNGNTYMISTNLNPPTISKYNR